MLNFIKTILFPSAEQVNNMVIPNLRKNEKEDFENHISQIKKEIIDQIKHCPKLKQINFQFDETLSEVVLYKIVFFLNKKGYTLKFNKATEEQKKFGHRDSYTISW